MKEAEKIKINFYLALPLFNMLIISLYAINYDNVSQRFLPLIIYITLFICVIAVLGIKVSGKFFQIMQNAQLILFSFILFFLFCELIASLSINLVPLQIRNRLAPSNIEVARGTMVEYINGSPFVKFKPNITIRSQGYRGNDFIYEWKSDHLGFKNLKKVANKKKVRIVAVGDSFTESMGVATDRTWASILTRNGYSTYNLGVQGYSPTQMEGSLRKYGLHLNPDYIIIGYMNGLFARQALYSNKNDVDSKFTGGIKSIADNSEKEIRIQGKYIFSAAYLFVRTTIHRLTAKKNLFLRKEIINQSFKEYAYEVFSAEKSHSFDSDEWKSTLSAFDNIIKMAKEINSKVILLYMPDRGTIYYKAATGNNLPENNYSGVESYKLQKYAEKNNISFLNTSETLIKHMETIKAHNFNVSKLPYFRIDGHMSNKGNELVADAILEFLANNSLKKSS